ncbi:MAG TPA: DUF3078 domain-containing protein [Bacteroidales bacterium]|jgi:hypothetical protein|nr:DUF3078 domain-containing protein [Bacteroidales bacterium]HQH24524.1 DUF3078 domain-containing protein [Bacteroidales bacterium]HQJ83269.1 DUF3078 domain-containing protein [Bacteroidales bacterium]
MSLKNLKYLGLIFISLLAYNAYSQDKTQTDSLKRAMTDGQAVEMADSSGVETADSSGVELIDNPGKIVIDSLKRKGIILSDQKEMPEIVLSAEQAVKFLQERSMPGYWKNPDDPLRAAIRQLVFKAINPPWDSAELFISKYPFDSLNVSWDKFYVWKPVRMKIPAISPPPLPTVADTMALPVIPVWDYPPDTARIIDIKIPEFPERSVRRAYLKDTVIYVVADTLREVVPDYPGFPFTHYDAPFQGDSLRTAVRTLSSYIQAKDSSIVYFTGLGDVITPVWLNSRSGMMHRYWLKTDLNDSVTVWIGSQDRNTIGLYLETGVSFARPVRQGYQSTARIELQEIDKSTLLAVKKIITKPLRWKYHTETSFALNQAALSNWVKGGESNISTSIDITGYADYTNKPYNITSNNFARIKYGLVASGDKGVRKNLDLLETNSKINHKAFGKFDFSGILLFKTQIAKGYNYPNDSVPVSKFLNPGILTLGVGLDYKPDKNTSLNFSPVSYKGTYVPDTANIDQTKYGIAANRRSKNEFGASFMISNVYKLTPTIALTNRLQLFTNYINNPQNIDIDWEMIVTAKLNWFTDVRLNTHLIFDDDTKTAVYDKDNKPVMGPDNQIKKTARVQFKQLLGFSFIFRF